MKIQRIVCYLLSFGFARGILFVSPIVLANLLPTRDYGRLEWSFAAASLLASFATLGTGGVVPLIELKKVQTGNLASILTHYVLLTTVCVMLFCVAGLLDVGYTFLLTALFAPVVALQGLWSTYLKTHGRSESSLLLDAGAFALMTIAAILTKELRVIDALPWLLWFVSCYALCLYGVTVVTLIKCLRKGEAVAYRAVLALGFPLMIAGLVTVAATTSGRLVIGYLGGALLTAEYAVLARAAALPMVVHQVVMVAKFRHLFTLQDKEMEQMLVFIFGMVALSGVVFGSLFTVFGWVLGPVFVKTFNAYPLPTLWILAQSVLWSAIAVHDLINTRNQSTHKVLPWSIGFLLVSAPVAIVLINYIGVSLEHFVYVHGLWMLLFYLNQILAMYRAGIRLMRAWALAVGSYVSLITLASLLYY